MTNDHPPRLLVIGAHPDDCEYRVGGLAALYRQCAGAVCFVSVTDGRSGHQTRYGPELAALRRDEALASGRILGIECRVLSHPDGALRPTLEVRDELIRLIRGYDPDLVVTHRPNDYHPDHRATSQLVCDASYLLTVPAIAADVPALRRMPLIMYMFDDFERPYPFSPSVAIDIDSVFESLVEMLACHGSQFFDWLPYNRGVADQVPSAAEPRRRWLRDWYAELVESVATRHRGLLIATYGPDRGSRIKCAEAFETCEYGAPLTPEWRQKVFPFLPE